MQILPSKGLSSYIKHYLFLESVGDDIKKLRLFSDGNTGLVFSFKNNITHYLPENQRFINLPNAFIYGQISDFKDLFLKKITSLIIVVFQPYGIHRLLGMPANELKNSILNIDEIMGQQGLILYEELSVQQDLVTKLQLLNSFFLKLSEKMPNRNQILIDASLDFILKNGGEITIAQLVKHIGYTERHIERLFSETIGLNPKKFGNIVQLHHFLKLLRSPTNQKKITDLCYNTGYVDQSHLIKVFRKYTGITPTQYLNNTQKLAVNFIEFKTPDAPMSGLYNSQ